jgi:hypothetical protein
MMKLFGLVAFRIRLFLIKKEVLFQLPDDLSLF